MWERQVAPFTKHFRLVRYDRRGHGKSGCPRGPTRWSGSAATCWRSSTRSTSRRSTGAVSPWAAWSGNGSAPMRPNASRAGARPTRRAISPTRRLERPPQAGAGEGVACLRRSQHGALVHQGLPRARAGGGRAHPEMFAATPLEGYIACGEAVRDMDHRALLPKITAPTLVIAGRHDPANDRRRRTSTSAKHIPGAKSRCSTPRTCPTSSSGIPTRPQCSGSWRLTQRSVVRSADVRRRRARTSGGFPNTDD